MVTAGKSWVCSPSIVLELLRFPVCAGSATIRACSRRLNSTLRAASLTRRTPNTRSFRTKTVLASRLSPQHRGPPHPVAFAWPCDPRHGIDSSERFRCKALSQSHVWWKRWAPADTRLPLYELGTAIVDSKRPAPSGGRRSNGRCGSPTIQLNSSSAIAAARCLSSQPTRCNPTATASF